MKHDLHIRHSKRAKRLSLRANPKTAQVELIVPPFTLPFLINRFVKKHEGWIAEKQKSFIQKTLIKNGAMIFMRGCQKSIEIHAHTKRTTLIEEQDNIIAITTSRDDVTQNFKRWLIAQAKEAVTPLAYQKASVIDKDISKIDLRDTHSRWGSCSSDGRLMLSWRLIMAPSYVLDYVVGHEVAHLQHMDHSPKFWDVCYRLSERPVDARQWLKDHGNSLLAVF